MSQAAIRILRRTFGYQEFRKGQTEAIEAVLAGRDALVVLPTGGGKSLTYQVPALVLPRLTVVVSPLISLMKDQVDTLTRKGVGAAFLNSTLSVNDALDRLARATTGHIKLVYVAPERLESDSLTARLRAIGVSLLAVDEAHCISQWGHDFRPSYLRLRLIRTALGNPTTLAVTATATPRVRADIARSLGLKNPVRIVTGFDRANLSYAVAKARTEKEKDAVVTEAVHDEDGTVVVYAPTRRAVERVSRVLTSARLAASPYHAGLAPARRRMVQELFMNGDVRVIVATNAFGMGVDKSDVRLVVHYAMPGTLEAYYQEAGRAGRDGEPSKALLIHSYADRFTHEFFIGSAFPPRATVERVFAILKAHDGVDRATLSALCGKGVGPTAADSAIRVMVAAGIVHVADTRTSCARIRILASAARIKRELGGSYSMELEFLRTLWRAACGNHATPITIDLDSLPPGFGGGAGSRKLMESLAAKQFLDYERSQAGLSLVPRASLSAIDWASIEARRSAELEKLHMMQGYGFTKECRRAYVLRYFGERRLKANCGACDNCT